MYPMEHQTDAYLHILFFLSDVKFRHIFNNQLPQQLKYPRIPLISHISLLEDAVYSNRSWHSSPRLDP